MMDKPAKAKKRPKLTPFVADDVALDVTTLSAMAKKLAKKRLHSTDVHEILSEGHDGHYERAIVWHLVAHGSIDPAKLPAVLWFLAERPSAGPVDAIFDILTRVELPAMCELSSCELAPGVPSFVDDLLVDAYRRDPALVEARAGELTGPMRLAFASLRRRFGHDLSAEDASAMLDHLAAELARGRLSGTFWMVRDGSLVEHRLTHEDAILEAADLYGPREELARRVMSSALRETKLGQKLDRILDAAPLEDVAEIAVRAHSSSTDETLSYGVVRLARRSEPSARWFEAAAAIVPGRPAGDGEPPRRSEVRDHLLALGAARCSKEGVPVPTLFDESYTWDGVAMPCFPVVEHHVAAFAALPRERAFAMADRQLADDITFTRAAIVLAAHPDGDRLVRMLDQLEPRGLGWPRHLAALGAAGVPAFVARLDKAKGDARRVLRDALLYALDTAARRGEACAPEWFDALDWQDEMVSRDLRDRAIDAFSPEARREGLRRAAAREKIPSRVLASRHVLEGDDALLVEIVGEVVRRDRSRALPNNFIDIHNAELRTRSGAYPKIVAAIVQLARAHQITDTLVEALDGRDQELVRAALTRQE